jgi:hypothetical protein
MPNPGLIAPHETRRMLCNLPTLVEVLERFKIVDPHRTRSSVFQYALAKIKGFGILYGRNPTHKSSVNRFYKAFHSDIEYWIAQGKKEFEGILQPKQQEVNASGSTEDMDDDDDTDEYEVVSFDVKQYEQVKREWEAAEQELRDYAAAHSKEVDMLQQKINEAKMTYGRTSAKMQAKRVAKQRELEVLNVKKRKHDVCARLEEINKKRKELEDEEKSLKAFLVAN